METGENPLLVCDVSGRISCCLVEIDHGLLTTGAKPIKDARSIKAFISLCCLLPVENKQRKSQIGKKHPLQYPPLFREAHRRPNLVHRHLVLRTDQVIDGEGRRSHPMGIQLIGRPKQQQLRFAPEDTQTPSQNRKFGGKISPPKWEIELQTQSSTDNVVVDTHSAYPQNKLC